MRIAGRVASIVLAIFSLAIFTSDGAGGSAAAHETRVGPGGPTATVQVRSADGRVSFPFRLVNNHVIFQATIRGTRLDLLLDTGMPMDGLMLYRTPQVESVKFKYVEGAKARIAGAGGDGTRLEADLARDLTVDIGDLRLKDVKAIVTPPLPALAAYHDGIIGATIFNNFVVAIDYDAKRITLSKPDGWEPPNDAVSVPLTVEHNTAFTEVTVLGADGRRTPTKVVVDLGASHPISLHLGSVEGLEAPAGAIRTIVGLGVSGRVQGLVGRIAGLEIGGFVLRDVITTFPDHESRPPGLPSREGGNLGDGILKAFNVAFDYTRERMVLAPNKAFGQPFEWDMSGLLLRPDGTGVLRVENVVEKSPAGEAGLVAGDIVTRVDGRDVSVGDVFRLRDRMRRPDETLQVTVQRDGKSLTVTFTTTRLV